MTIQQAVVIQQALAQVRLAPDSVPSGRVPARAPRRAVPDLNPAA